MVIFAWKLQLAILFDSVGQHTRPFRGLYSMCLVVCVASLLAFVCFMAPLSGFALPFDMPGSDFMAEHGLRRLIVDPMEVTRIYCIFSVLLFKSFLVYCGCLCENALH